ncbi:hypothetical protein [Aquimarina algicola]|uniref:Uncharacterized protein n=1 Tax=Aquimarina algicola TaxID=2589995 RepID=A0A504JHQ8_9FLAO|nr:hypothetical protein [Aquimarina algicola]TPN85991.1 hypothetical protein FHK87_11995 [Aquimarina algicola]
MRLFFIAIVTLLMLQQNYAQTQKNVFFNEKALINKFHTINQLKNLKKGELITLYTERVTEIVTVLPYLSLTNEANIKLSDIGIKENSDHLKTLNKHHIATEQAIESNSNLITEFIPYADTEKIIWAILYFEEVIKKIRIGYDNNF